MIIDITTHGASLHRKRERFIVKIPDQKDEEVAAEMVEAILITSNAMISTAAVRLCIERHIQLVVASWSGKPIARMWASSPGRQTQIRRQQYMNLDTVFAFDTTKKLLLEKLSKQKRFLSELKQNREPSKLTEDISDAVSFFNRIILNVKDTTYRKDFAQHFLGFEGSCATRYFEMVSATLPKKWRFDRRTQNPGLDPFNAALNYLYGMTYSSIEKIVILSGLDPTAGFYHKDSYAKPTLVFDLIEPCRPAVDKALVYLFSRRIARDEWFSDGTKKDGFPGVEITKQGRGELIKTYKDACQKPLERSTWKHCREIVEQLLYIDRSVEKITAQ